MPVFSAIKPFLCTINSFSAEDTSVKHDQCYLSCTDMTSSITWIFLHRTPFKTLFLTGLMNSGPLFVVSAALLPSRDLILPLGVLLAARHALRESEGDFYHNGKGGCLRAKKESGSVPVCEIMISFFRTNRSSLSK